MHPQRWPHARPRRPRGPGPPPGPRAAGRRGAQRRRGGRGGPARVRHQPARGVTTPEGVARQRVHLRARPRHAPPVCRGAGAPAAPPAAHPAQEGERSRLGPHLLGRGAGAGGRAPARRQGALRGRGRRLRLRDTLGERHLRLRALGGAPGQRLRQPELDLRHRALQLAQGPRPRLHLRRRRDGAGFLQHRLRAALGPQSQHVLAGARDQRRGGEGARRQARRRRSAPGRSRQQGGSLGALAARHRRGAGARGRRRDARRGLVRPRLPARRVPRARVRGQRREPHGAGRAVAPQARAAQLHRGQDRHRHRLRHRLPRQRVPRRHGLGRRRGPHQRGPRRPALPLRQPRLCGGHGRGAGHRS